MITLSQDQRKALDHILVWYKKDKEAMQYITLGGFAGTGKTTLIAILRRELEKIDKKLKVGFASYTGKAARVLRWKLQQEKTILKQDSVGTIHSLIYSPIINDRKEIIGWKPKDAIDCNLIIIDEASMVDGEIWQHLLAYHVPIIAVGDHGQLSPIRGNFNLMQKPDLKLEAIHRQAKHNPIIALSIKARENGEVEVGQYCDTVKKFDKKDYDYQETINELLAGYNVETLVLCGYNHTRRKINQFIRNSLGFTSIEPVSGDRVICLRNNHMAGIFNGMLGTVETIEKIDNDWYLSEITMDGEESNFSGYISVKQFNSDTPMNFTARRAQIMKGDLFDFGYALTVHKAQGSQAKRVILFEERFAKMTSDEWRRWLYTAVTRAEEELYIF